MDSYIYKYRRNSFRTKMWIMILIIILLFIHLNYLHWSMKYTQKYHLYQKQVKNPFQKVILYWDTMHGERDMGLGFGNEMFENCPVKSCFATNNKHYMPIDQFDAIIFHGARYKIVNDGIPESRNINQTYIFLSMESAFNTYFETKTNKNFYNWTMTFRTDSDIYFPYGLIGKYPNNYTPPTVDQITERSYQIAWFVSNCRTKESMKRLRYVRELRKYIPVHIYGTCGNFKCDQSMAYCYQLMERNYKFYLSFENSFCRDYVTEKLFNVLNYDVIPVVYGLANYSAIAPPYSVINVMDFAAPKQLAEYLWKLDDNVTAYLEYFKWKSDYVVEDSKKYAICQLCDKLHQPLNYSWYRNVQDWFYGNSCVA